MRIKRTQTFCAKDQLGFILSIETILFAALLITGTMVGMITLRDSINAELMDTANAIQGAVGFAFFSDPERGTGLGLTNDALQFIDPIPEE